MGNTKIEFHHNCLNLIRLIAAIEVMYGHVVDHLQISVPYSLDVLIRYFQGVPIFYILSGFLIWNSIKNSANMSIYFFKRFWRIYPEMWCAILINSIVIICLYKKVVLIDLLLFCVTQGTIFQFWTPESLRGYGCGTPNGALWTMGVIIEFYFLVWYLKKYLGHDLKKWIFIFIISIAMCCIPTYYKEYIPSLVYKLYGVSIFKSLWLFLIGVIIAQDFDRLVPFLSKWWILLILFSFFLYIYHVDLPFMNYSPIKSVLMVSGLIGFAYRFPNINISTDISFGIYVYHMIIVNILINYGCKGDIYYLYLSFFVSIFMAIISTKSIGNYSKKRKQKVQLDR